MMYVEVYALALKMVMPVAILCEEQGNGVASFF